MVKRSPNHMELSSPADEKIEVRRGTIANWLRTIESLNRLAENENGYGPVTYAEKQQQILQFFIGDSETGHASSSHYVENSMRTVLLRNSRYDVEG